MATRTATTTIRVRQETSRKLDELSKFGESKDGIVRKLVDFYERHAPQAET